MRLRLFPRSLFGRMLLILFAGLAIMQIITTTLLLRERLQQIGHVRRVELSLRLESAVRALESVGGEQRQELATLLSQPGFRLSFSQADTPSELTPFTTEENENDYISPLREALGMQRSIKLKLFSRGMELPPERQGKGRRGRGMHDDHRGMDMMPSQPPPETPRTYVQQPAVMGLAITVTLNDGSLLTAYIRDFITSPPPPETALIYLASLLLGISILSFCAVRLAINPLRHLAAAADQLGQNLHAPPLPEVGSSEVRQAATAFNRMQGRLIETLAERTQILAAISHDLQTPITRMRLRVEMLDVGEVQTKFIADLDMMRALVREGLDLARSMDPEQNQQSIDLTALLETLVNDAVDTGQQVSLSAPARSAPYKGSLTGLQRCLTNLIDNAVKFGETAEVTLEDTPTEVRITVRDHGPGIPEEHLETIFKPFYRLEASRNRQTGGTGLGLSIARNIAISHGGSLALHNHPDGGAEAILRLPRQQKKTE